MATKLYVGNLSYSATESSLRPLFAPYGEIESISVITDRETGRARGFAFVEMATQQGAEEAIRGLNGKMVDEREIKVNKATPKPDRDRGGSRGSGGRSRGGW